MSELAIHSKLSRGPDDEAIVLGVRFDLWSEEALRVWTRDALSAKRSSPLVIAFSNPEFVVEARTNHRLREYLNRCDANLIDGIGVSLAVKLKLGWMPPRNTGTNFLPILCEALVETGRSLFLFGGKPGVAERARDRLVSRFPGLRVVGTCDGYKGKERILEQLASARPDVLMVCLGNPIQEEWIEQNLPSLNVSLVFGNGGAMDFWAGDVPMAPRWVQRIGLEWLFRLITNFSFRRLYRFRNLGVFAALVALDRLKTKR